MAFVLPPKRTLFPSVFVLLMGGWPLPYALFQLVLIFGCLVLAWCAVGLMTRSCRAAGTAFGLAAVLYNPIGWQLMPVEAWLAVVGASALMTLVLAFKR